MQASSNRPAQQPAETKPVQAAMKAAVRKTLQAFDFAVDRMDGRDLDKVVILGYN